MEVNIISDRIITAKLLIDTININIVSESAPQVGCTDNGNEEVLEEQDELIRSREGQYNNRRRYQWVYWKR